MKENIIFLKNKLFRITLDKNLSYYYVSPNIKKCYTKNNQTSIIVEIKYDYDDDMALHEITNLDFHLD